MKKEIREKLEAVLEQNLDRLRNDDLGDTDRQDLVRETSDFLTDLNNDEELASKAEAERTRCELEKEKIAAMAEAEAKKSQFSWLRFGTELAGCLIPMLVGAKIFKNRYYEGMEFEKEGRWTAKTTKDLFSQVGVLGERLPGRRR